MRKALLIALGIGAAVLVRRRATKMGLFPAALLTMVAEKTVEHLSAPTTSKSAPKKASFVQRLFGSKASPGEPKVA